MEDDTQVLPWAKEETIKELFSPLSSTTMDSTILTSDPFLVSMTQVQETEECAGQHTLMCVLKKTVSMRCPMKQTTSIR